MCRDKRAVLDRNVWNPQFDFVPIWNKNLNINISVTKLSSSSQVNCLKPWKLRGFFASAQTTVRRTEPSNIQKKHICKTLEKSDAKILLPTNQDSCGGWDSWALGVTSVHLEGFPSVWQPCFSNSHEDS